MTRPLAIWDVNGTLIDSRRVIQDAMARAFEAEGYPAPGYERTRQIVGLSLHEAVAGLAPDLEGAALARLVEAYKHAFIANRSEGRGHEPMYAGARETLERLANAGWSLAIATGKSRRGLRVLFELHGIEPLFDTVWCADDGPGKPHPFLVLEALNALGAQARQAVMIGDTSHDVLMARAAGVRAHAVSWGFHRADELEAAGADWLHHDFTGLNSGLDRFAAGLKGEAA